MRIIILLLVLIVAATVTAVPYYIGTNVEKTFRLEVAEAAKEAALSGFNVKLVDYQRGIFGSIATTRLSIIVPQEKKTLTLDMRHKISHIPQIDRKVIATVDSELVLGNEAAKAMGQLFKGQTPVTIKTLLFFDGHQEGLIHSPSAKGEISGKQTVAIDWQGLDGTAWQSAGRDKVTFNLHTPGITISPVKAEPVADAGEETGMMPANSEEKPQAQTIRMKELRYQGELQRGASGMWHGNANASIANISVNLDKGAMPISMLINSISIKGQQSENNGLIKAGGAITANTVNFNGFLLSNAVYDVTVENIDAKAMLAWQKTVQKMMQGEVNEANPLEPMKKHIPALFNARPILKINDISVDSPMGRFAVKMNARVNGKWDDMLLQNPAMVIPMLKADLETSLPRAIVVSALKEKVRKGLLAQAAATETEISPQELQDTVDQTVEQQLGGLIAQGFITENAAQLGTHIEFAGGKLTVNGIDASPMLGAIAQ